MVDVLWPPIDLKNDIWGFLKSEIYYGRSNIKCYLGPDYFHNGVYDTIKNHKISYHFSKYETRRVFYQ